MPRNGIHMRIVYHSNIPCKKPEMDPTITTPTIWHMVQIHGMTSDHIFYPPQTPHLLLLSESKSINIECKMMLQRNRREKETN